MKHDRYEQGDVWRRMRYLGIEKNSSHSVWTDRIGLQLIHDDVHRTVNFIRGAYKSHTVSAALAWQANVVPEIVIVFSVEAGSCSWET